MKNVLIITYYWPPSGGAGVQRWIKFVKYLTQMGANPIVLTVDPAYATYPQLDHTLEADIPPQTRIFRTKSFELYALYKKVSSNKEVPYGGFANTKKVDVKEKIIRFLRGNLVIPDPRKGWNNYAIAKAKELIQQYNIDTVITTSPPHSTQLIGLKLKKELNIKWVADLRDPWTDIYYFKQMYPTFIAKAIHKSLERQVLTNADKVITVSPALKQLFDLKATGVAAKTEIIPNGYDADDFKHLKPKAPDASFTITYTGTLSSEYNLSGLIQALKNLPEPVAAITKLRFVGKMPASLVEQFRKAELEKMLVLTGYVPHEQAIEYMFSTDVLLLVIPEVKNNEGILTGKIFEYLASKNPILLIGPVNGDAAHIIRETNSGTVCNYTDNLTIEKALTGWHQMKTEGEQAVSAKDVEKYTRENLTRTLVKVLASL